MTSRRPTRVCLAVTSPLSTALLRGQIRYLKTLGYEVVLVSAPGKLLDQLCSHEGALALPVPFARRISPLADARAAIHLCQALIRLRPAVVNAGTPKAGLLVTSAAWLTGVPVRIYTVRGLRYERTAGLKRFVLQGSERIACSCATRVICVSPSVKSALVRAKLCHPSKARVIGHGSSNGVTAEALEARLQKFDRSLTCRNLGLPSESQVIGFVGRLSRDKGVDDLVQAFRAVTLQFPTARLVVVGDHDPTDPVSSATAEALESHPQIIMTGHVSDPLPYYGIMDLLVLPSWREGFPNAPLEAASVGIPTVAYRATGSVDAVVDGVTGLLVTLGDHEGLAAAITRYLGMPKLRQAHGRAAQERARRDFRPEAIWKGLESEYQAAQGLIGNRGLIARAQRTFGQLRRFATARGSSAD